ncbi:hypothetical protein CDL15_Pgr026150 [Punica granatum]|uniref:Uncharacterized protein n=1 Tax=Punica granatum TaxID=22663 RepID=A0A218WD93_PUNGR|nr:hypothetical protein CDL15_Pgr026150 [Punica granatum]
MMGHTAGSECQTNPQLRSPKDGCDSNGAGSLPRLAAYSSITNFHNRVLQQMVQRLQIESAESKFLILDIHTAFTSTLKHEKTLQGVQ